MYFALYLALQNLMLRGTCVVQDTDQLMVSTLHTTETTENEYAVQLFSKMDRNSEWVKYDP